MRPGDELVAVNGHPVSTIGEAEEFALGPSRELVGLTFCRPLVKDVVNDEGAKQIGSYKLFEVSLHVKPKCDAGDLGDKFDTTLAAEKEFRRQDKGDAFKELAACRAKLVAAEAEAERLLDETVHISKGHDVEEMEQEAERRAVLRRALRGRSVEERLYLALAASPIASPNMKASPNMNEKVNANQYETSAAARKVEERVYLPLSPGLKTSTNLKNNAVNLRPRTRQRLRAHFAFCMKFLWIMPP